MYFSAFITHTFFSLLLFQLQDTTTAKYDSGLMRLRAQKRSLADSQRSEMTIFSSSDNHLTPEESSTKKELTTSSSSSSSSPGGIFVDDESDPGQEKIQQSWLLHQGGPVDETMLLTACTTSNTDESDQSILPPSAKFQRRQSQTTVPPNACPPEWKDQPGQQKLNLDGQDQENGNGNGERIPDDETLEELERQFHPGQQLSKWNTYPTYLELFRLFTYGRVGDSNSICDEFVGRSVPMCAPSSLSLLDSPAEVLAPSRFCKLCFFFFSFLFFSIQYIPFSSFHYFSAMPGMGHNYFEFLFFWAICSAANGRAWPSWGCISRDHIGGGLFFFSFFFLSNRAPLHSLSKRTTRRIR